MKIRKTDLIITGIVVTFVLFQWTVAPIKGLFFDEGTYTAAGMRLLEGHNDNYGTWFSGSPYMAPVLYGIGFLAQSETGARLIAALFIALSVCAVARATRNLFGETEAVFAAIAFATVPNTLALGHLAVHDAPAVCFIAWAFWAVTRQAGSNNRAWSVLAGSLMGIAAITKYPFVIMAAPLAATLVALRGRKSILDLLAFALPIASAIGIYFATVGQELITSLSFVGSISHGGTTSGDQVFTHIRYAVWMIPMTLGGAAIAWQRGKRFLALVLLGSLLIWPAYHVLKVTLNSQNKHVVLGFVFCAPLCGVALNEVWKFRRSLAVLTSTLLLAFGLWQSFPLDTYWTDQRPVSNILEETITPGKAIFTTSTNWVLTAPLWKAGKIESPWNIHDDYIPQTLPLCDYNAVVVEKRSDRDYPASVLNITPESLAQCGFEVAYRDYQTLSWMGSKGRYTSITVELTLYLKP